MTPDELRESARVRLANDNYRPALFERLTGKRRTPPHRRVAAIISPFIRVLIVVLLAAVAIIGVTLVAVFGLGFERMTSDPRLALETIRSSIGWLLGLFV